MSTTEQMSPSPAPLSRSAGQRAKDERIRHFHKHCKLLSEETTDGKSSSQGRSGKDQGALPDAFPKAVAAVALATILLISWGLFLWLRSPLRLMPDYRLGADYRTRPAADALYEPQKREIYVATAGDGVHAVDSRTGYFRHLNRLGTQTNLLSDDVVQLQRDEEGRVYFLCQDQSSRGLCRVEPATGRWRTLLGLQVFEALTSDPPPGLTSALFTKGQLWLGTDRAGVGVYNPATHAWDAIHQAAAGNLRDDCIRDLVADSDGHIWIATPKGLNRVGPDGWESFDDQLLSPDVQRLKWAHGKLWYVTAAGGLGTFDGRQWQTLAGQSSWGDYKDADVKLVAHDPRHGRLWFVARNNAVGLYDLATRSWTSLPSPGSAINAIAPVAETAVPKLWAATSDGMSQWDEQASSWQPAGLQGQAVQVVDAGPASVVAVTRPRAELAAGAHLYDAQGQWRQLVGSARGPRNVAAVAASADHRTLYVGSEAGISCYDVGAHDWSITHRIGLEATGQPEKVIDLQADGSRLLALTDRRTIVSFDPDSTRQVLVAGGEHFAAELPDLSAVTAVTRDVAGVLWLATSKSLFTYDPHRRSWAQVSDSPPGIQQLCAARDAVWALAGGKAFVCGPQPPQAVRDGPAHLVRVFASVDSPGAVALDQDQRVFQLIDAHTWLTVVGDAASGLDLNTITQVAALPQTLVLGGTQNDLWLYDTSARNWTKHVLGPIAQVVVSQQQVWIRTASGKLLGLAPPAAPENQEFAAPVLHLAADESNLVALLGDGSLQRRTPDGTWNVLKSRAEGPRRELLADSRLAAVAADEVLALAGGPRQQLCQFSWSGQTWHVATAQDGQPLEGITQLGATSSRIWALAGQSRQLFSAPLGTAAYQREHLNGARQIRTLGDVATVVDERGDVWLWNGGVWEPTASGIDAARSGQRWELSDVAEIPAGLLVAGTDASAILPRSLETWRPVGGNAAVDRLYVAGGSVWGTSAEGGLYQFSGGNDQPSWRPIGLDSKAGVASFTPGAGADEQTHWACLTDGSVVQIGADRSTSWHHPAPGGGRPADVVGVEPLEEAFVVAYRQGVLSRCTPGTWAFTGVSGPDVPGISRFVSLGAVDQSRSYWLLATDGRLYCQTPASAEAWRQVGADVLEIATAGDRLLAVSDKGRRLQAFGAAGNASDWLAATSLPTPLAAIEAAGELAVADDRVLLIVSDGKRSATYDPQNRRWHELDGGYQEFSPVGPALLGRTESGDVVQIRWEGAAPRVTPLRLPGKARRIAGSRDSTATVAWLDDGRLVLVDERGATRELIGSQLRRKPFLATAAWRDRCYVATGNALYAYDIGLRRWQPVIDPLPAKITSISRLWAGEAALWMQAEFQGVPHLFRFDEKNGTWAPQIVTGNLLTWDRAAGGVLLQAKTGDRTEFCYDAPTLPAPIALDLLDASGPPEQGVVAARSSPHTLWLYTQANQLWSYDRIVRAWKQSGLPQGTSIAAAILDGQVPVVITDQQSLQVGRHADETGGWEFEELAAGVGPRCVDLDGERIVFGTSEGVFVWRSSQAVPERAIRFNSAWAAERKVAALAVAGQRLFAANEAAEVAEYDYDRRTWRSLPEAPWQVRSLWGVDDKLHAVGPQKELAVLTGDRWVSARAVGQTSWADGDRRWTIDGAGRVREASRGKPAETPDESQIEPLPDAVVRRVHADGQQVWLEFADGSLWRYDAAVREAVRMVPAPEEGQPAREGLISVGGNTYFLAAAERRVAHLTAQEITLRWLDLPDLGLAPTVGYNPSGLLFVGSESAAVVSGTNIRRVEAGSELDVLRRQLQPLPVDRQRQSGEWSIAATGPGDASTLRLMRRIGSTSQAAAIDARTGRFAWDVVTSGISWTNQHVLATRAGIALHADMQSPPTAFFPVISSGEAPLELILWDVNDAQVLVEARDGRRWILRHDPDNRQIAFQELTAPKSVWNVSHSDRGWSLSLAIAGALPVDVSLNDDGRLGLDRVEGLAFAGESLLLGTPDGVLEYSRDLTECKGVVQAGRHAIVADRQRGRILAVSEATHRVQAYDGTHWSDEDSKAFAAALDHHGLKGDTKPLRFRMPTGQSPETAMVEYRDSRLESDTPSSARAVTADGQRWYLGTAVGLTILDVRGSLLAVYPWKSGIRELQWLGPPEQLVLHALDGDGKTWQWDGKALQAAAIPWEGPHEEVRFAGSLRRVERVGDRFRFACTADKPQPVWWLDPALGGFARDAVQSILFTGTAVWKMSDGCLERLPIAADIKPGYWELGDVPREPGELRTIGTEPMAILGNRAYRLRENEVPLAVELESAEAARMTARFAGRNWTLPAGNRTGIRYRRVDGRSLELMLDAERGFACDYLHQAAISRRQLVLETAAGTFRTTLPGAGESLSLEDLEPIGFEHDAPGQGLEQLWVSPTDQLWGCARGSGTWFSLDPSRSTWHNVGDLPDSERQAYDQLCERRGTLWRRRDGNIELAETTDTGQSVQRLDPDSQRFPCDRILAVLPESDSMWLLTAGGLRHIERHTGRLLAADDSAAFRGTGGEFLSEAGQRWLKVRQSTATTHFELQAGAWRRVADEDNPLLARRLLVEWESFRVWQNREHWEFELSERTGADRWLSVAFLPDQRRFEFQVARGAVSCGKRLHVESPLGVVTWQRGATGWQYEAIRSDLRGLCVSPDRTAAQATPPQGPVHEHRTDGGWMPRPETSGPSLLTESRRWQVQRSDQAASALLVRPAGERWVEAPLDAAGDFEFRRPQQVAIDPTETAWTLAGASVVRYRMQPDSVGHPENLYNARDFPGGSAPPQELFTWNGNLHARSGQSVWVASDEGHWQTAPVAALAERHQRLWSGGGWEWQRSATGDLQITRQFSPELVLRLAWNAAAGRFDRDLVSDAALWNNSLWLAHDDGISHLHGAERNMISWLASPQRADRRRFALRRADSGVHLLVADADLGQTVQTVAVVDGQTHWEPVTAAEEAATCFTAAYHDPEWHFELGASACIWRGTVSELKSGFFAHDYFYNMTFASPDLWTPTPVGLLRHRLDREQLVTTEIVPLPSGSGRLEIVGVQDNAVRVIDSRGTVLDWDLQRRQWDPVESSSPPERVLVDSPLWRWTRPRPDEIALAVKIADQPVIDPILHDGRFGFDEVNVGIVDGDCLWLAGPHGIMRRDVATGELSGWYRSAYADGKQQPLSEVIALRRFRSTGEPLPSVVADQDVRKDAALVALDARGAAWRFDGQNPGAWEALGDNPWQAPDGRWVVRTDFLDAAETSSGEISLSHPGTVPLIPDGAGVGTVLSGGRFLADMVRAVAFQDERGFLATPAGVVELDEDAGYLRLWEAGEAGNEESSSPWTNVLIGSRDQALYVTGAGDQAWRYDPDDDSWKLRVVDEPFRSGIEILHEDDFWVWSRWNGRAQAHLLKTDANTDQWPLFADGRFSFDVLRAFCLAGLDLWATTPSGVVRFRREDMRVLAIHRLATDRDTARQVAMLDVDQFLPTDHLACAGDMYHYERRESEWVRLFGTGVAVVADASYEDGLWRWKLTPWTAENGENRMPDGGFLVQCFQRDGAIRSQSRILPHEASKNLRRVVAADGRLWICLDRGLYVYHPR